MLAIGNANPDRVNAGVRKKKLDAKACCWVEHSVEISSPTASVLIRNSEVPSSMTSTIAAKWHLNHSVPTNPISATWMSPMRKNGTVLPRMNSIGRIGVTMICSRVPISRSLTIAKAVRFTIVISVRLPMIPGTKNHLLLRSGLYHGRSTIWTLGISSRYRGAMRLR